MSAYRLRKELLAAGFGTRAANAIAFNSGIETLEELKTRPLGDRSEPRTLLWQLARTPNLGPRGMAEVEAFRAGIDPGTVRETAPKTIGVPFGPGELAALDAFIANQPKRVSRPEAIRAFVAAGLLLMGADGQLST